MQCYPVANFPRIADLNLIGANVFNDAGLHDMPFSCFGPAAIWPVDAQARN